MKKYLKIALVGVSLLTLTGCGEIPTLSDGSSLMVELKDLDSISTDQLYNDMKESYALNSIIKMVDKEILTKKYENDLDSAKEEAKNTAKANQETYGESYVQNYFGSLEAYEDYMLLENLRDRASEDYAKTLVTENEIKEYYKKNIYGDVNVKHILVTTKSSDQSLSKTKKEDEAKEKINKIIDELNRAEDKEAKFNELVKQYSEDDATKEKDGSLGNINTNTLSSDYDELLKAARSLKDGDYSKEIITTEVGYHVIYRVSSSEKPSLEDKKDEITTSIAKDKMKNDGTIEITALDNLRKEYGMSIKDEKLKSQYSNYIANKISSVKESEAKKNSSK